MFSALPGGYRYSNGSFYNIGNYGLWWSATEINADNAWYRLLGNGTDYLLRHSLYAKSAGLSVRLLRD